MPIIQYDYKNGKDKKIIGTLDPDTKTFSKTVKTSKHLHRKSDSWGIDGQYFTDVLLPNEYTINVNDIEEHIRYSVPATVFKEHGTFMHFNKDGKDHGAQIFLPRRYWTQEKYESKKHIPGVLPKL